MGQPLLGPQRRRSRQRQGRQAEQRPRQRRQGRTPHAAPLAGDPFPHPSPHLGCTPAVIGNCGFTIAPCKPADRDLTMRNLTQVEGMSLDVLRQGIVWDFESFPEYLTGLRRRG